MRAALSYASAGQRVFWCKPGQQAAGDLHGFKDATTDLERITRIWTACPELNPAVPTGVPGPDVLDVDVREGGNGFAALGRLKRAELALRGAQALVRTPFGGLHVHFAGTDQQCGRLPDHYVDFKSRGGYVLVPPSVVGGRPYELLERRDGDDRLNWAAVRRLLDPPRHHRRGGHEDGDHNVTRLIEWVARQNRPGHRHDPLKWAAFRLLEAGQLGDTVAAELVGASVRAGHAERDAWACVRSIQRKAMMP